MKKKILIIGGTGFIGKNLVLKLRTKNFKIFSLSHSVDKRIIYKQHAKQIKCDITNKTELKKKLDKLNFDFIINLSGYVDHSKKVKTMNTHYNGLKNLVEIFKKKKFKLFIQIGTSLEYGAKKSPQFETFKCKPKSHYGLSKLKSSEYLVNTNKKIFFPYIILRLYQIYGPHQKTERLLPLVVEACLKDKTFSTTAGTQLRDFLYVDDLNDLIIKILRSKVKNEIFNVGSGQPVQIKKLILKIKKIIGKGMPKFGMLKMRKDETIHLYPNINKVKKFFNWKPKTNLTLGLNRTINHFKKFNYN